MVVDVDLNSAVDMGSGRASDGTVGGIERDASGQCGRVCEDEKDVIWLSNPSERDGRWKIRERFDWLKLSARNAFVQHSWSNADW